MSVPEQEREYFLDLVRGHSVTQGECRIPTSDSIPYHSGWITGAAAWAIGVTGKVWQRVLTGLCGTPGCIVHVERSNPSGSWVEGKPERALCRFQVRPHQFHPTCMDKTSPRDFWRLQHGEDPPGRVRFGACGVRRCVKHLKLENA